MLINRHAAALQRYAFALPEGGLVVHSTARLFCTMTSDAFRYVFKYLFTLLMMKKSTVGSPKNNRIEYKAR